MKRRDFLQSMSALALTGAAGATSAQSAQALMSMTGKDSNDKPFSLEQFAGKVCLISFFHGRLQPVHA